MEDLIKLISIGHGLIAGQGIKRELVKILFMEKGAIRGFITQPVLGSLQLL